MGLMIIYPSNIPIVKSHFSISVFANFESNTIVENQIFYLTLPNTTNRLGYLSTYPTGNRSWHWGSRRYNSGWEDRGVVIKDPNGLIDNVWYHLVFILSNKDISLYVNGKLLHTIHSIYDSDIETLKNFLFLIGGTTEGYQWMYGKIDELRFYNRALSEEEIKALYEKKGVVGYKPHL